MVSLNITEFDCANIADFLELYFFQNIRDDDNIDNLGYVRSLLNSIDELRRVSEVG